MPVYAVIGAGFRILARVGRREFRFYLAKGYCKTATKKKGDDFQQTRYFSLVLNSYNKYLRRRSDIEIKDIKRIYASYLMADTKEKNEIIKLVCESLEGDSLKLARFLSSVYKLPETDFFVGESIPHKLIMIGTIFASASPIIISLVSLLLKLLGID
jgi:hypothetical protein